MTRVPVLAILAIVLGAVIVTLKVASDGLTASFVLLLGGLLIADGVLRLLARQADRRGP